MFRQIKALLGISLFVSSKVIAQSWVGSDDFNSSVLDSTKWSFYSGSIQLPLSQNFIKTNTGISFYSSLDIGESWGLIVYRPSLPTNVDWSAQVQAKIDAGFVTSNTNHFVEALMTVTSDLNSFNSFFTNCLHKDSTQDIAPNWSNLSGNSEQIKIPTQLSDVILRFDYIASTKKLIASYANPTTPNSFTTVKTLDVSSWGESLRIAIGGYTWDCTVGASILTMDNFQVTATASIPQDSPTEFTYSGVSQITIDRYNGTAKSVIIPSQINGIPVTRIGEYAFNNCTSIESMTIPATVTTIEDNAFTNCSGLIEITIPDSVTIIKTSAFIDCKNLLRVTLGKGFHTIGYHMFYNCWKLQEINIPSNITTIGYEAFYECYALKSMVIPDSVTSIDPTAFKYCTGLESLSTGNGIAAIGDNMFYGLYKLKNIAIGTGVRSIGSNAFGWCTSLLKISLPSSVTSITSTTFKDCFYLSFIDLGDGLETIPSGAFQNMWSLKTINIGKKVTEIGIQAFYGVSSLKKVVIAGNLSLIGSLAFGQLTNCEIIWLGKPPIVTTSDIFNYGFNVINKYTGNNALWSNIQSTIPSYPSTLIYFIEYTPSKPSLQVNASGSNNYNISFQADLGLNYRIESSSDLSNWETYATGIRGDDSLKSIAISNSSPKMFFRAVCSQ